VHRTEFSTQPKNLQSCASADNIDLSADTILGNPSRMAFSKLALALLTFLAILLPSLVCGQLAEVKATLETPAAFGDDAGKLKPSLSSLTKL
jgi:hypothetical protein